MKNINNHQQSLTKPYTNNQFLHKQHFSNGQ